MRDFLMIMKEHGYYSDANWSKTEYTYEFETGSKIEFFSADNGDRLRGARRDRLFINEANNIAFEAFEQLEVRTKEFVFLDWNPSNEYWFYTEVQPNRDDIDFLTLTYKDNEALDPAIVKAIEQRKVRTGWWQVYGLGQLGEVEGKIYTGWQIIDSVPHEARLVRRGMDFGYSNDPSTIVDVYEYNGGYILDEQLFKKGMDNKQLADFIGNLDLPQTLIIADSAEPKSIDEIKGFGYVILPCEKGADSIRNGIQVVQPLRISVTKRSTNIIKEYRNYLWMTDRDGNVLNVPEGGFDHTMDAIRYALVSLNKEPVDEFDYDAFEKEELAGINAR